MTVVVLKLRFAVTLAVVVSGEVVVVTAFPFGKLGTESSNDKSAFHQGGPQRVRNVRKKGIDLPDSLLVVVDIALRCFLSSSFLFDPER